MEPIPVVMRRRRSERFGRGKEGRKQEKDRAAVELKMEGQFLGGRPKFRWTYNSTRKRGRSDRMSSYFIVDIFMVRLTAFDLIINAALVFCYVRYCCCRVLLRPFALVMPVAITCP